MVHLMLDLETFSSEDHAAIRSIGSCLFDPKTGDLGDAVELNGLMPGPGTFHLGVDLAASKSPGHIDPRTVDWWLKQSGAARQALVSLQKAPLETALNAWECWVHGISIKNYPILLWSNGPLFDERVLRQAFERNAIRFPIHYRESRCFRTIVGEAKNRGFSWKHHDEPGATVKHDALNDCFRQAEAVIEAYKFLGLR